jgi:hypothetical protein
MVAYVYEKERSRRSCVVLRKVRLLVGSGCWRKKRCVESGRWREMVEVVRNWTGGPEACWLT